MAAHAPHQPGRPPLSEARIRTPLPSGPRLEKSLSLPGIESLKNELQSNVPRTLSTPNRGRYTVVHALLLHWHDDDDVGLVRAAVDELADVLEKYYHYTFHIRTIPAYADGSKSSWRWLSRQLSDFAEDCDQRDVLKIVYYAGHTYLDGNREMVLARYLEPSHPASEPGTSTLRLGNADQVVLARETPERRPSSDGTAFSRFSKRPAPTLSSSWTPPTTRRRG